jgi:hypothetical protein
VKAHYYLGQAYENSNWYHKAIEQYQIFLEFWGEAGSDLAEVSDAREKLTRLRQNP